MTIKGQPISAEAWAFVFVMVAFACLQVLTTHNVLALFPAGFETEGFYHPLAINLLNHGSYELGTHPEIELSTFRPPAYPVVLAGLYAIFGADEIVGVIFNNAVLFATLCTVFAIGQRFHPWVGLVSVVLLILDPIYLAQSNRNQSDVMFMFLLVQCLYWKPAKPFSPSEPLACGAPCDSAWRRHVESCLRAALADFSAVAKDPL